GASIGLCSSFLFNSPPTSEIYTLSLHDALPISGIGRRGGGAVFTVVVSHQQIPHHFIAVFCDREWKPSAAIGFQSEAFFMCFARSEEHTSELQSRENLVCRLLLEKKKAK